MRASNGQFFRDLHDYVVAMRPIGNIDDAEERVLRERWVTKRDQAALERLLRAHVRLMATCVRRHAKRTAVTADDLMQEAIYGYMRGLERFNPERSPKVGYYCMWWVRLYVDMAVYDAWSIVPVHRMRDFAATLMQHEDLEEAKAVLMSKGKRVSAETLEIVARRFNTGDLSTNAPLRLQDGRKLVTVVDRLCDEAESAEERAMRLDLLRFVDAQISLVCTERERMVVERMLLQESTFAQVGAELGVTRARAQQILAGAVQKLQRAARRAA